MEIRMPDEQWQKVGPLLSKQGVMGRPRVDDRKTLEAILYVLITGCRWNDLPKEYGSFMTAWRRLKHWMEDGALLRVWRHLLADLDERGKIDWSRCALDGSCVRAKKGATKSAAPAPD